MSIHLRKFLLRNDRLFYLDVEALLQRPAELAPGSGLKVIATLATPIIGHWVAGILSRTVLRPPLMKRNIDPALVGFMTGMSNALMRVFVVIASLRRIGIQTTSFVAIAGAAGLAVGRAR